MKRRCACGCGRKAPHKHHVVTRAELKQLARTWARKRGFEPDGAEYHAERKRLIGDKRNLVSLAWDCHLAHHNAKPRLPLAVLPDSCFEFALEVLGAGPAWSYMRRHYSGGDPRLDALLEAEAA